MSFKEKNVQQHERNIIFNHLWRINRAAFPLCSPVCTQRALVSCSIAFYLRRMKWNINNCLSSLDGLKVHWLCFENPVLPRRREQSGKRFQKDVKQKNGLSACDVIPHCTACNGNASLCAGSHPLHLSWLHGLGIWWSQESGLILLNSCGCEVQCAWAVFSFEKSGK